MFSWCALAAAEPLPVKHVEAVRVSIANKAQHALALRALPGGAGWQLDLAADGDGADVVDVTPGTPARTLALTVVGRTLRFDALRFAGGHVYRVQLRGDRRAAWSYVYLYPDPATLKLPRAKAGTERVRFDADEAAAPADDGAPARTDKGSL
ncbi:MAG TPA: hypothetical protein VF945_17000 [Polyangia bacterium]